MEAAVCSAGQAFEKGGEVAGVKLGVKWITALAVLALITTTTADFTWAAASFAWFLSLFATSERWRVQAFL